MNMKHYKSLLSQSERANYLLQQSIGTKLTIKNLQPVFQAVIGDIGLPIYSENDETEDQVIAKAKGWLETMAKPQQEASA